MRLSFCVHADGRSLDYHRGIGPAREVERKLQLLAARIQVVVCGSPGQMLRTNYGGPVPLGEEAVAGVFHTQLSQLQAMLGKHLVEKIRDGAGRRLSAC